MILKDDKNLSNIIYIDGEGNEHNIVQRLYIDGEGNPHEIFSSQKVLLLGQAPINVSQIVKDYQHRTIDNFYIYRGSNKLSFSENAGWEEHLYWLQLVTTQSYNASTGNVDFYFKGSGSYLRFYVAFVDKPEKLIRLGNGTSWNIKGLYPTKYNKLTDDNFLIHTGNRNDSVDTGRNGQLMKGSGQIIKSYNAETGILSAYIQTNIYTYNVDAFLYFGRAKEI